MKLGIDRKEQYFKGWFQLILLSEWPTFIHRVLYDLDSITKNCFSRNARLLVIAFLTVYVDVFGFFWPHLEKNRSSGTCFECPLLPVAQNGAFYTAGSSLEGVDTRFRNKPSQFFFLRGFQSLISFLIDLAIVLFNSHQIFKYISFTST